MSAAVNRGYGAPIVWQAGRDGEQIWRDADAVREVMEHSGAASDSSASGDDAADNDDSPRASGAVHGYLEDRSDAAIVDVLWSARAGARVLNCTARFNPRGGAKSFSRHDAQWLVNLLGDTVRAARGDAGRIVTSSWLAEDERRMRSPTEPLMPFWLGEVTFLPRSIDPDTLPTSLVAHPCPVNSGDGAVVVLADLAATAVDASKAVDDIMLLRPYLSG